jgi:aminodeoxyfutalosine deaminase
MRHIEEMIVRAPVVVVTDGPPIFDGGVRIERDRIVEVRSFSELNVSRDKVIELDSHVLLPGLINAHCHLDYTVLRGKIPPHKSFTDWIRAINAEKANLGKADYVKSITDGAREALRFGTTSMLNLEAFPELIARCPVLPLRVWWCAELIDVARPEGAKEIVAAVLNCLTGDSAAGFGLAPHALFTASAEMYRQCSKIGSARDFLLSTHLAESRDEIEMFRDRSGPLLEFLRSLGRYELGCDSETPLKAFLRIARDSSTPRGFSQNDRRGDWIVAHLNELVENDFNLLQESREKFSVAHCPRSHRYFRHSRFAYERLRDLGFNICLATDSLASNTDLSLFAEMREFQRLHSQIPADQLLQMVTTNPARALGRGADLGQIASGYLADLIALPITGPADIYDQVVAFDKYVPWMMIAGEVLNFFGRPLSFSQN